MCGFVHVMVGAHRGQRCQIPLKLGQQVVVSLGPLEEQHLYSELLSRLFGPISVIIKRKKLERAVIGD